MITVGELDTQIIIQKGTPTRDAMGGSSYIFETVKIEYAKVDWKDGSSEENENRVSGITYIEFTIRDEGNNDISANLHRVAFPITSGALEAGISQYYTIEGIKLFGGRKKWRTLICSVNSNDFRTYTG
mgnify:FL=1|tara:strand:- start:1008 stop:1391 length:384 start_codon:yes stop_codon:yes gene_type:complete